MQPRVSRRTWASFRTSPANKGQALRAAGTALPGNIRGIQEATWTQERECQGGK